MSVLTVSAGQKPRSVLKEQPILSKLFALHAAYKRIIKESVALRRENAALRARNKSLERDCALMEAQVLQLRDVVTLQTCQNMQLSKTLRELRVLQKN